MTGKIGFIGIIALAVFVFGSFYIQLSSGPSHSQSTRLDPYGEISVHIETQPDPPKTGTIPLILHITDSNGKNIAVDKVHYEYAHQDRSFATVDGQKASDGSYRANAALTDVGEWQVQVTLFKGTQRTQVQFVLRVMANI